MNFKDNDPVFVLQGISSLILEITAEVYDTIGNIFTYGIYLNNAKGLKTAMDNLNLCALYIDQGINTITTDALCAYGAAAEKTPMLQIKGNGDIVLKAGENKSVYASSDVRAGSPAGMIHEKMATAEFGIKATVRIADLVESAAVQVYKSYTTANLSTKQETL